MLVARPSMNDPNGKLRLKMAKIPFQPKACQFVMGLRSTVMARVSLCNGSDTCCCCMLVVAGVVRHIQGILGKFKHHASFTNRKNITGQCFLRTFLNSSFPKKQFNTKYQFSTGVYLPK